MRPRRPIGRLRLSLLILNGALLALASASYSGMGQTTAAETVAPLPPASVTLELPEPVASLPPLGEFDSVVERALFHGSRRPLAAAAEAAEPVGSLEGYTLKGTIIRPDTSVAILEQAGQSTYLRAAEGDVVAGWRLERVEMDQVVFELRGRSTVLEIAPFEPPPPAPEPENADEPLPE